MALKLIYGGGATAGAANGTLVSSSNKIVFTALDTPVAAFVRADDDTYSADASFSMPSDGAVQISFTGTGGPWYAFGTNPNAYGADIGDLNVAVHLRQHANASASFGTFQTDASTPGATALTPNPVSGFTATGATGGIVNLSWTAVTNRTAYQIDRATNSGFTTGVTLDISPGLTATTLSDTGRTTGTTYYYRIKAIGTGRYADTASYATANATPLVYSSPAVVSVSQGSDDVFRRLTGDAYALNGNAQGVYISAGRYTSAYAKYGGGMRFQNVQVPQGATITSAFLALKSAVYDAGFMNGTAPLTRIRAQAADNPSTFLDEAVVSAATAKADFDARILTSGSVDSSKITTSVAWDDQTAAWSTAGVTKTSPDIKTVIQAIVNRSGWAPGNSIVIFWDDFDGRTSVDNSLRAAADYEEPTYAPPQLTINFT